MLAAISSTVWFISVDDGPIPSICAQTGCRLDSVSYFCRPLPLLCSPEASRLYSSHFHVFLLHIHVFKVSYRGSQWVICEVLHFESASGLEYIYEVFAGLLSFSRSRRVPYNCSIQGSLRFYRGFPRCGCVLRCLPNGGFACRPTSCFLCLCLFDIKDLNTLMVLG
jgi:hypothetical protein